MKKTLLTLAVGLSASVLLSHARPDNAMKTWWCGDAPEKIFPNIDRNARLDMVDYLDAGVQTPSKESSYMSDVSLVLLEDRTMTLRSDGLTIDLTMLVNGTDTAVVAVSTIPLGRGESFVSVYGVDGSLRTDDVVDPAYSDWLVKDALQRVSGTVLSAMVPYVTATASVDLTTGDLTFTNTATSIPGIDESVAALFKPTLTYARRGGRYVLKP